MATMYERINNRRYEDDIACALVDLLDEDILDHLGFLPGSAVVLEEHKSTVMVYSYS